MSPFPQSVLVERGVARARHYSWDRTVEGTIAAYRAFAGIPAASGLPVVREPARAAR